MFSSSNIFDDDYISDASSESDSDSSVQWLSAPALTVIDSENDDAFFGPIASVGSF